MIVLDIITIYTIFSIPMHILCTEPSRLWGILPRLCKVGGAQCIVTVTCVPEGLSFSLFGVGVRDACLFQFPANCAGEVVAKFVVAVGKVGGCIVSSIKGSP